MRIRVDFLLGDEYMWCGHVLVRVYICACCVRGVWVGQQYFIVEKGNDRVLARVVMVVVGGGVGI
jgi:hypothetical protein